MRQQALAMRAMFGEAVKTNFVGWIWGQGAYSKCCQRDHNKGRIDTMATISYTTHNAIENMKAFDKAYHKAYEMAVKGLIKDVLGEEFSKKQFNGIRWANFNNEVNVPTIETLREYGWVTYRVEEFELPEHVKNEMTEYECILTFKDGTTKLEDCCYYVPKRGEKRYGKVIESVRPVTADDITFKGRRYIYHVVE